MRLEPMDHYDLQAVFHGGMADPQFVGHPPGSDVEPFTRDQIDLELSTSFDPSNSGEPDFYALGKLDSGRWAALVAWHDYTGWD